MHSVSLLSPSTETTLFFGEEGGVTQIVSVLLNGCVSVERKIHLIADIPNQKLVLLLAVTKLKHGDFDQRTYAPR